MTMVAPSGEQIKSLKSYSTFICCVFSREKKYLVWLKLNMATSEVWPNFKMSLKLSSGSVGGTIVGSDSPQKLYWQNTKWDREGGNPAAFFIVTWNVLKIILKISVGLAEHTNFLIFELYGLWKIELRTSRFWNPEPKSK